MEKLSAERKQRLEEMAAKGEAEKHPFCMCGPCTVQLAIAEIERLEGELRAARQEINRLNGEDRPAVTDLAEEIVQLQAGVHGYIADIHSLKEKLQASTAQVAKMRSVLMGAETALGNLIEKSGHESILLKKHPSPCRNLDFCVMSHATRQLNKIQAALSETSPKEDLSELGIV